MGLPAKRLKEIESEERTRFEEKKVRLQVREKLLDQEPWRRLGKTKVAAYMNAAIILSAAVLVSIWALIWLGLV